MPCSLHNFLAFLRREPSSRAFPSPPFSLSIPVCFSHHRCTPLVIPRKQKPNCRPLIRSSEKQLRVTNENEGQVWDQARYALRYVSESDPQLARGLIRSRSLCLLVRSSFDNANSTESLCLFFFPPQNLKHTLETIFLFFFRIIVIKAIWNEKCPTHS